MPYWGSIAGGYSNALDAISQQSMREAERQRVMETVAEMKRRAALAGPGGATLNQLAQMFPPQPPGGMPPAPGPGQASMPAAPPMAPPPAPMAPPPAPMGIPPYTRVPASPGTPRGEYGAKDLPAPPFVHEDEKMEVLPTLGERYDQYGRELTDNVRGPTLEVPLPSESTGTTPGLPPAAGIAGGAGAPPGAPGAPPAPPAPPAGPAGPAGPAAPGIPPSSIAQSPTTMDLIRAMKAAGVPQDQMVGVLESVHPMFANEYRAAMGAQHAAIETYKAIIQQGEHESKDQYRRGILDERGAAREERAREADAKIEQRGKEQESREKRDEEKLTETRRRNDAQIKKWEEDTARLKASPPGRATQAAQERHNSQIQADRDYILANPPGSKGAKDDLNYATRVERAMTQKQGDDDPNWEKWRTFKVDGATGGGTYLEILRDRERALSGYAPSGREAVGTVHMHAEPERAVEQGDLTDQEWAELKALRKKHGGQ